MGRVRQGLFAAACWLVGQSAWGQGLAPAPSPYYASPASYSAPVPGEAMYERAYGPAQIQHRQMHGGYGEQNVSPEVMQHLLPADRGWLYDHDSRLDLVLKEYYAGSWVSIEYLNWQVHHQARTLLGANPVQAANPTKLVRDPTQPFDVPFNDPVLGTTGLGRVAHTGDTDWSDINGIKGSFGIPITKMAWLEGSFWGLEETTDAFNFDRLPAVITPTNNPVQMIVVPLLSNGAPGTRVIVYDNSFSGSYSTQAWSADANLVFNHKTVDQGWSLQSIAGFRHIEYGERMGFGGSYTNISGYDVVNPAVIPAKSNRIDSSVDNFLYGAQLGFRTEFHHKYFTLGIEPKVLLSANMQKASVETQDLREPGDVTGLLNDGVVRTAYRENGFSPGLDLSTYAKVHVTDWLNFKIGYNLLWLDQLGTADKNIYYNDTGDVNPPAVVVRKSSTSRFIDGLTIGGEILLP